MKPPHALVCQTSNALPFVYSKTFFQSQILVKTSVLKYTHSVTILAFSLLPFLEFQLLSYEMVKHINPFCFFISEYARTGEMACWA
jgi:hypothetical protein